jgi:hypothetical protein
MEWKRIALLFSIILIIAAFYRVILNNWVPLLREGLEPDIKTQNNAAESGNTPASATTGLTDIDSTNGFDCSNNYSDINTLPLREYFIKSCFNTAYNGGTDISTNTVGMRLAEGYRFIDLNVFYSEDKLYVGYSDDNAPTMFSPNLLFESAISFIHQWGFTDNPKIVLPQSLEQTLSTTPPSGLSLRANCYNYPLFVNIRVYRPPNSTNDIISKLAEVINKFNYGEFYRDDKNTPIQINGCTPLNKIMGKIIFTMDIENIIQVYAPTNTPSAEYVPADTIKSIQSFVNMLTGGNTCFAFYDYNDAQLTCKMTKLRKESDYKTNTKYWYIAFPNPNNDTNPDSHTLVGASSIQIIPVRTYVNDRNNPYLKEYTKIFEDLKTPFACMSYVFSIISPKLNDSKTSSSSKPAST